MKDSMESVLEEHFDAIGKWASEDSNRVAFVVCGELNKNSSDTVNALVGRDDKMARVLFGNAMEDEISGKERKDTDADGNLLKKVFMGLLDAIKDRIKHD